MRTLHIFKLKYLRSRRLRVAGHFARVRCEPQTMYSSGAVIILSVNCTTITSQYIRTVRLAQIHIRLHYASAQQRPVWFSFNILITHTQICIHSPNNNATLYDVYHNIIQYTYVFTYISLVNYSETICLFAGNTTRQVSNYRMVKQQKKHIISEHL